MIWLDVFFVVWAIVLAASLGWILWEAVGLARRRRSRQKGGA